MILSKSGTKVTINFNINYFFYENCSISIKKNPFTRYIPNYPNIFSISSCLRIVIIIFPSGA